MSRTIVERMSNFIDRHSSRRGFLRSLAISATAVAFAPVFLVRPIGAQAAISTCTGLRCGWPSHCCDGWTEFCCVLTGENVCPPVTVVAGWWKVDNSKFCSIDEPRPRYFIDCNLVCEGKHWCSGGGLCPKSATKAQCRCPGGCETKKIDCVQFRYGQCNQDVCVGPIHCRVVTCVPPWRWDPACRSSPMLTNEFTRNQDRYCLHGGFLDVPPKASYARGVEWISKQGIAMGMTDRLFVPDEPVRLEQLATWLWVYAGKPTPKSPDRSGDVPTNPDFASAIAWMVEERIERGRRQADRDPSRKVSRAKAITYLYRLAGSPPATPHAEPFPDIRVGSWYTGALDWATSYGIVWWSPPMRFEPSRPTTRAEAAAFLYRFHSSHDEAAFVSSEPQGLLT